MTQVNCPTATLFQEVSITTNALSAELGGGLGVVQMTTKSGTNEFHGDLAYRMRNEAFNANGTANDIQGIAKQKYRLNEESGAIGGPVRIPHVWDGRNKVFFFVSFARDSHPTTSSGFQTVPTALERTGDFSASFMPGYGNTSRYLQGYLIHMKQRRLQALAIRRRFTRGRSIQKGRTVLAT